MRLQAIGMPRAYTNGYITKNNNNTSYKGNGSYVIVPSQNKEDSFVSWTIKSVLTASLFSLVFDIGTNALAKSKNLEPIPFKEMPKNALKATGIFLLIGTIFQGVSSLVDKKLK